MESLHLSVFINAIFCCDMAMNPMKFLLLSPILRTLLLIVPSGKYSQICKGSPSPSCFTLFSAMAFQQHPGLRKFSPSYSGNDGSLSVHESRISFRYHFSLLLYHDLETAFSEFLLFLQALSTTILFFQFFQLFPDQNAN